jgi:glutamate-ammonia-ligase adenylyltransferase
MTMTSEDLSHYIKTQCPGLLSFVSSLSITDSDGLTAGFCDTCNPRNAANRLDDLLSGDTAPVVKEILKSHAIVPIFLATISGSRFLFSILMRRPSIMEAFFLHKGYVVRKIRSMMERELRYRIDGLDDVSEVDRALRIYKEEEFLRIGCRDLAGLADVQEIMAELSDLAAASVQTATSFHWNRLVAKHGRPLVERNQMGLVVIGMGKVSGRELNFSSDLDLIFFRQPEEGLTDGSKKINVVQFYESLTTAVTRSLSEITEDGFVFRIDLRLRPEGDKGELVPSITNALDYYLGWGRTWERAALMKAIPLAGDFELGEEFLKELEPFIYRRYLDYSTLEDMRLMKSRIEAQIRSKPGINIKLGQGGIREIEFFVQTLQLINGGRTPRVRSQSTLEALALLHESGLLDKKTMIDLRDAYLFFRKTEHRIQINHQVRTHELPRTPEEQEELARNMGYREDGLKSFLSDLEKHRGLVEELFSSLLYQSGDEVVERLSREVRTLATIIHNEEATCAILQELGFENPHISYPIVRKLFLPSDRKLTSEKGGRLLQNLAPVFIEELAKVAEPGKALVALDSYIDALQSTSGYFSTFLENPPTVRFLIKILGESRFFTELLIRHPQAIDSLIARGAYECPREKQSLENHLAERLAYAEDLETELDALRILKHEEMLSIGVHQLSGEIDSQTARKALTELAEVCLQAAIEIAVKEMSRKMGALDFFDPLPLAIVGMGKLGGTEMTYLSDLDVVFVYDPPLEKVGRYSIHEIFTRLVHRVISILTTPTSEGTVYAMDTRLRPSGNQGPLVSSISSFREYHRTASQLWEKQALIKARPVAGSEVLANEIDIIVRDCVMQHELSEEDLEEIARVRRRMETELAVEDEFHVDLKTGQGGLVDVEFFVQANILKHSWRLPAILSHNTLEALLALRENALISEDAFLAMDSGYRFLINLEDRLRLMKHRSIDRMPLAGENLRGLARRLGYGEQGDELLINEYRRVTRSIRQIYDLFFQSGNPRVLAQR